MKRRWIKSSGAWLSAMGAGAILVAGSTGFAAGDVKIFKETERRGAGGTSKITYRVKNDGADDVREFQIDIRAKPMSFWGLSEGDLSIYPDGIVSLYFFDGEGAIVPKNGGEKTITVFSKNAEGGEELELSSGRAEISRRLLEKSTVGALFGVYGPVAREMFRAFVADDDAWGALVGKTGKWALDSGGAGLHSQALLAGVVQAVGEAMGEVLQMRKSHPGGDPETGAKRYFLEAERAHSNGNLEQAEQMLRQSVALSPGSPRTLNNLGYVIFQRGGDLVDAEAYIRAALAAEPDNPHFLGSLAEVLWGRGERLKAVDTAEKARTLDTDDLTKIGEKLENWRKEAAGTTEGGERP